ncbi:MAG TPA: hypothetical protein VG097_10380 [Gemmata sp.]|jgi:hypothetical protein|nr:hypothetical protein [Gemmata sp.]
MTTTLELPDDLLRKVESHAARDGSDLNDAVVALLRIGLATAASAASAPDESMLEHRRALTQKFISGEWGVELAGYEEARAVDRRKAAERAKAWRE